MKTRHPRSSSRENALRWQCDAKGCFNKKKRPKIERFAKCFPRNIMMSDVDGEVEINGHWARLEWKAPGVKMPTGQRINYEKLTTMTPTIVFVVNGDAETMDVCNVDVFWKGKINEHRASNIDELDDLIIRWAEWAEGPLS